LTRFDTSSDSPRALVRRLRAARSNRRRLRYAFTDYLRGDGIELGPLHEPYPLLRYGRVRYVDKWDYDELCRTNPDVPPESIVQPSILADAHDLAPIPTSSISFIIASHVFEHLHNPIRALLDWRRTLVDDGVVLLVVPDASYTFDRGRPLTTIDHLLWDYENEGSLLKTLSDVHHIAECNLNMQTGLDVPKALDLAQTIARETYNTHFHVWTHETLIAHLTALRRDEIAPFAIREAASDGQLESVIVLQALPRRHADAAAMREEGSSR